MKKISLEMSKSFTLSLAYLHVQKTVKPWAQLLTRVDAITTGAFLAEKNKKL